MSQNDYLNGYILWTFIFKIRSWTVKFCSIKQL